VHHGTGKLMTSWRIVRVVKSMAYRMGGRTLADSTRTGGMGGRAGDTRRKVRTTVGWYNDWGSTRAATTREKNPGEGKMKGKLGRECAGVRGKGTTLRLRGA